MMGKHAVWVLQEGLGPMDPSVSRLFQGTFS